MNKFEWTAVLCFHLMHTKIAMNIIKVAGGCLLYNVTSPYVSANYQVGVIVPLPFLPAVSGGTRVLPKNAWENLTFCKFDN